MELAFFCLLEIDDVLVAEVNFFELWKEVQLKLINTVFLEIFDPQNEAVCWHFWIRILSKP